jgi:hypothetical protein
MLELVMIAIGLALMIAGTVLVAVLNTAFANRNCPICGSRCSLVLPHRRSYEDRGRP